jgi:hypothetical protein
VRKAVTHSHCKDEVTEVPAIKDLPPKIHFKKRQSHRWGDLGSPREEEGDRTVAQAGCLSPGFL